MERGVVGQHERRQVEFPVQGGCIHERSEIFGDCFVGDFGLAVALWVVSRGCGVLNLQKFEQIIS